MIKRKRYDLAEIARKLFQAPQKREMVVFTVFNGQIVKGAPNLKVGDFVFAGSKYRKTFSCGKSDNVNVNANYYSDFQYFYEYLEGCGF